MEGLHLRFKEAFKNDKIIVRRPESFGIWASFLLPLAVILGWLNTSQVTEAYKSGSIYAVNILLNVFYLIVHVYQHKSLNVTKKISFLYGIPLCLTIYLYFHLLKMDLRRSFCYMLSNGLLYFEGLPFLLKVFPKSFTFGEANVVIQGISLFIFSVFLILNDILLSGVPNNEYDLSSVIMLVGLEQLSLSWVLIFCIMPYVYKKLRLFQIFYIWGLFTAFMIYMSIFYVLNLNCFKWIYIFLTKPERVAILCSWFLCSAVAIFIVLHHINVKKKSNTMIRKYFHGLIVIVYISGIFIDINLLYFSSGCVFGLFVILEVFRILRIPPLHKFLVGGFSIYCDEKDAGNLGVTPISLLVGHSIPLWLHPFKDNFKQIYLPLLSGVFSVGLGDTFASIGGKLFGRLNYKDSVKTIEGTICCIMSQLLFISLLTYFNIVVLDSLLMMKSVFAIFVTSLVEVDYRHESRLHVGKMSLTVFIGVRLNPNSFERIPIYSLDVTQKIEELKKFASSKTNVPSDNLELIFCGVVMEDNKTLESCGIRSGVTVHVIEKKKNELVKSINTINEADILYLVSAFKNASKNPNYRSALQRLSRPEILENIIAATPGLADDPISVTIIQNPELLTQMCDTNTVRKVVELHPSLAEAANCIVAVVHEEAASVVSTNPSTSSGYSYSLDALSDDEEVDSSQSSDSQPRHGGGENIFVSPITPAQLAAALETATGGSNNVRETSGSIITTEMFNHAIQQAFAGVSTVPGGSDPSRSALNTSNLGDLEATSRQLARHLQQMHEIGLRDDTINLQALQATDWNVQEAINLVFSGAIGEPESEDD